MDALIEWNWSLQELPSHNAKLLACTRLMVKSDGRALGPKAGPIELTLRLGACTQDVKTW